MVDQTVFNEADKPQTWEGLGKYANAEEALASVPAAQTHISTLEAENATLREQADANKVTANQVLDALNPPTQTPTPVEPTTPQVSKDEIVDLISNTLAAKTIEDKEVANEALANAQTIETYGDKANEVVLNKATELGVNLEFFRAIAKASPDAFQKLLATGTPPTDNSGLSTTPSEGGINTSTLTADSGIHDWAYYKQMQRDNPKQFKTVSVQQEMMQQRSKLGARFLNK